jgi:DNA-binding protein HU-beta
MRTQLRAIGFSVTRRGDKYVKLGSRLRVRNVVPGAHDFEGALCDTAAFPRFSRNFEMNSSELVTIVAEANDISKAQTQAILDSVLKSIVRAAASDDEVSLAGFGKFKVKASPEREGRNPANGEKIKIAASKKLSFSPAKAVKDVLNS